MDIKTTVSYLKNFNNPKFTLGLKNIKILMNEIGNPQDSLQIIHVAGTNGKGSVCQFISSILAAGGYRVGTFTSPYLVKMNEQLTINGAEISDEELAGLISQFIPVIEGLQANNIFPSYFEIVTAMALQYFYQQQVDFVVLEVGLGGAFDATNVISTSAASVITKISIDHTDYLGNTLTSIGAEKAGIIKNKGLVISPVQHPDVMKILEERCKETGASLNLARTDKIKVLSCNEEGTVFECDGVRYHTRLIGEHQAYNCSIALKAIKCLREHSTLSVSDEQIRQGVLGARWPGRFEKISDRPPVFIDGAHNVDGASALKNVLKNSKSHYKIAILGILADKEVDKILEIICGEFDEIFVTKPDNPRALDIDILADKVRAYVPKVHCEKDINKAAQRAIDAANAARDSCVVAFGSLYMIGSVRQYLQEKE